MAEDKLIIETPEQVPLEFQLAGIGSRFLAIIHDTFIQVIASVVLVILTILFFSFAAPHIGAGIRQWAGALLVILLFLLQFGYFIFFEALWNGQTPGKRHQHLRVIKDSGRPITALDSVGRNLMRVVDSLPFFYGVGIVSMLLSSKHRRLGDYLAGTVVVHERPPEYGSGTGSQDADEQARRRGLITLSLSGDGSSSSVVSPYAEPEAVSGYEVGLLTAQEFQLVEAFLLRLPQLPPDAKYKLGREITERIAKKIGISPEDQRSPILYLQKVVAEYRKKAGLR